MGYEALILCWYRHPGSNGGPLDPQSHGPRFLIISIRRLILLNSLQIGDFRVLLLPSRFPSSLFGGDLVAI
jgi:hypothetical protein